MWKVLYRVGVPILIIVLMCFAINASEAFYQIGELEKAGCFWGASSSNDVVDLMPYFIEELPFYAQINSIAMGAGICAFAIALGILIEGFYKTAAIALAVGSGVVGLLYVALALYYVGLGIAWFFTNFWLYFIIGLVSFYLLAGIIFCIVIREDILGEIEVSIIEYWHKPFNASKNDDNIYSTNEKQQ